MDKRIQELINDIEEMGDLDMEAVGEAEARQEQLAKPTGALGDLEDMTVRLAGITGLVKNDMKKQAVAIFSADNGVCDEGVASAPQSVTFSQTINFTRGLTGVSSMAKYWGIDLLVVDMGVKMDLPESLLTEYMTEPGFDDNSGMSVMKKLTKKIVNRSLGKGTANLAKGPAMTEEEAVKALLTGVEAARTFKELGYTVHAEVLNSKNFGVPQNRERVYIAAFRNDIPDTTKLIISQRISSVQDADRIIVLENGAVDGFDTHENLLKTNEIYREICEVQMHSNGDFDEKING